MFGRLSSTLVEACGFGTSLRVFYTHALIDTLRYFLESKGLLGEIADEQTVAKDPMLHTY